MPSGWSEDCQPIRSAPTAPIWLRCVAGLSERDIGLIQATRSDLLAFIAWRTEQGAKPRSTARQLSSFRRFYRFLLREGTIQEDPTIKIEMPRIGRSLPQSLTEAEVEALLAAPDVSDPLGHRDRTMLEVLYATGLRVSELINLKQSEINLNQGVLRIVGKGDRERLIPLGEEAQNWLQGLYCRLTRRNPARAPDRLSVSHSSR